LGSQKRKLSRQSGRSATDPDLAHSHGVLSRTQIVTGAGQVTTQVSIDISNLAAPERRYAADQACVQFNGVETVSFIFVQVALNFEPRSIVTVKMYADAALRLHESLIQLLPQLEGGVARWNGKIPDTTVPTVEPRQSVALSANMAQATFSDFASEIRFYHVSPYAMLLAGNNDAPYVPVEPVVQIDLSALVLIGALKQLDRIVPELPTLTS
jgi:hypothetical protein